MVDANESQHAVTSLLSQWTACGRLTYKFYLTAVASGQDGKPRIMATFSKPTPQTPAVEAVARLYFRLSSDHQRVRGFTVEEDPHFHDLEAVKFDEAVLDRVIRRKMQLQSMKLVDVTDEFASTRVPAVIRAREEEQREREREATEEYLLEQMQRADSYNDGKLLVEVFRETVDALELSPRVAPREVLLALVTSDRDDLMAYGDFVSVAADMIDTMSGADNTTPDQGETLQLNNEDEALDAFEVVSARQTHYTVEELTALVEAHAERVADAANAIVARRAAAEMEAQQDFIPEETKDGENEEEEEKQEVSEVHASGDPDGSENDEVSTSSSRRHSSSDHRRSSTKQYPRMSRYQLRSLLETPQLLLSEAEINLTLALAETKTNANGVEEVLCEKLAPLLRRVRRMIFRFQCKAFVDRVEKYLLHQFQAFEKRHLQGSSSHLKQRLQRKEAMVALKSMKKLLLSPYQLMQLAALMEVPSGEADQVVYYKEIIPCMVQKLQELVNVNTLVEKSAVLHEMGVWDFTTVNLPSEDTVKQVSFDCFSSFDKTQFGAIPNGDFHTALRQLNQTHGFPVGTTEEMKQLSALGDPTSSGRVNYALAQHLIYPLLLFLLQERELAAAKNDSRVRGIE
ncbi:hypothetical protein P3T76_008724 [Phytophthora citrophthora]|uniref:EF-hand domain-containing protein n=1 Tax=Phytophthora citrophthora TaxID=4793 RepID=A0AAD9GIS7_9STRA|nr:hypothetical protein P3T76_008724 [Phytophthora citrophthora]